MSIDDRSSSIVHRIRTKDDGRSSMGYGQLTMVITIHTSTKITMDPLYINSEKITSLLPMDECISVMEIMFRSLASGECLQPLRSLMWLPDKSGLLGMMPAYAKGPGMMGIKVISLFPGNSGTVHPSHQGVVLLFDAISGTPLLILDAAEITAIRTAAVSALATRLLSRWKIQSCLQSLDLAYRQRNTSRRSCSLERLNK